MGGEIGTREWERLNTEEGKGECNQESRSTGMEECEMETGSYAGIRLSSNPLGGDGGVSE